MDAKLMMSLHATRGEGVSGEGNWTEYMKAFNGRLYRPDIPGSETIDTSSDQPGKPRPLLPRRRR